jgi:exodeoxyribonuclease VII large subunit
LQSTIQHRAQQPLKVEKTQLKQWLDQVKANVQHRPRQAKQNIEGLIRYILSAGPQAQLKRGFVMVQDEAGQVIRTAQAARSKNTLQLRFSDGEVKVKVES